MVTAVLHQGSDASPRRRRAEAGGDRRYAGPPAPKMRIISASHRNVAHARFRVRSGSARISALVNFGPPVGKHRSAPPATETEPPCQRAPTSILGEHLSANGLAQCPVWRPIRLPSDWLPGCRAAQNNGSGDLKAMDVNDEELDQVIMSLALASWQKVAMILANSLRQMENAGAEISAEKIAARIEFLVHAGYLEGQGDLARWRNSEIRLPARAR